MFRKIFALCLILTNLLIFTACGNDAETEHFKADLQDICNKLEQLDTAMNSLSPDAENVEASLLSYLNDLSIEFERLAELNPPEKYSYISSLADEANTYMTEANTLYFDLLGYEGYTKEKADIAYHAYSKACKRVQVIISLLHGETPEGTTITYE